MGKETSGEGTVEANRRRSREAGVSEVTKRGTKREEIVEKYRRGGERIDGRMGKVR